jgi:LysM repeat protein
MPKPHPPRRKRARSGGPAGAARPPAPAEGLEATAAAAAESAAEAEASAWVDESWDVPSTDPPGWFRDHALDEVPEAAAGATPSVADQAAPPDEPDAADTDAAAADVAAVAAEPAEVDAADVGDAGGVSPPGTIYRTVPPLPEDAVARPRRRSPVISVLVGLLILVVVGAGGFGIGMLLPLLLPLPAGNASVASAVPTGAGPSVTPGASAGTSPGPAASASASPPSSVAPSPAATPLIYVVKRGDQLGRIAKSFGVTLQALEAANGITNPNLIVPGQKLVIPAPVASPSAAP